MDYRAGTVLFLIIIALSFTMGGFMQSAAFFGALTLLGLVVLVESIGPLKWLLKRTSKVLDIAIFILSIIATIQLGFMITAGLTVAGIGFSLIYAPYIREEHKKKRPPKFGEGIGKFTKQF